jgi:hypothetical protein
MLPHRRAAPLFLPPDAPARCQRHIDTRFLERERERERTDRDTQIILY